MKTLFLCAMLLLAGCASSLSKEYFREYIVADVKLWKQYNNGKAFMTEGEYIQRSDQLFDDYALKENSGAFSEINNYWHLLIVRHLTKEITYKERNYLLQKKFTDINDELEKQRERTRLGLAIMGASIGDGMVTFGQALQEQNSRRVSCTSNRIGQTVYTNCY